MYETVIYVGSATCPWSQQYNQTVNSVIQSYFVLTVCLEIVPHYDVLVLFRLMGIIIIYFNNASLCSCRILQKDTWCWNR